MTTTDDVLTGVDLGGKVAVVTGASTGIGLETARALAAAGSAVVLATRNREKTDAAMAAITDRVPHAELSWVELDLTSVASVRSAAAAVVADHPAVHLLINNAGVMYTPFEHTADGFELQFGTNHLGHFLFTRLLEPALLAGAPSRVVNLSSRGHRASGVTLDDPNYEHRTYDKFEAYGQSKTANILFTVELERRLGPQGVHAYAVHPGMILTELGRHMTKDDLAELQRRASGGGGLPSFKSIPEGAATTVWAATDPDVPGGSYVEDCAVSEPEPWATDADTARRLWDLSEELVGLAP